MQITTLLSVTAALFFTSTTFAAGPEGTFNGYITPGNRAMRAFEGQTVFTTKNRRLAATYVSRDENGTEYSGNLSDIKIDGTTLVATWTDQFGTGLVCMKFNAEFGEFDGRWSTSLPVTQLCSFKRSCGSGNSNCWTGVKARRRF